MVIHKATREQIERAMGSVNTAHDTTLNPGISAYGNSGINPSGTGYRLTLKLHSSNDPFHRHGPTRWDYRTGQGTDGKKMNYVCWHGHRAFMRALYMLAPDARIRSGMAYYKGSDHFEQTHGDTAYRNIGSQVSPQSYADACDCDHGACPARNPGRVARINDYTVDSLYAELTRPDPLSDTISHSGGGDTSCFEMPEGVAPIAWAEYNRKFNALIYGREK
jgi:hypothetical protein